MKKIYTRLFPLLVFFLIENVSAQTHISGSIVNQTWTTAGSPYIVDSNIVVATLTILPGVQVIFPSFNEFKIAGVLIAVGNSCDSIIFTKTDTNSTGWKGLFFDYSNAGSEIAYCSIEGSSNSGIKIQHSAPNIHHSTICNNTSTYEGGGILVIAPTSVFRINNCYVAQNRVINTGGNTENGGGISSHADSTYITSCIIFGNSASGDNSTEGGGICIGASLNTTFVSIDGCIIRRDSCFATTAVNSGFNDGRAFGGGLGINCDNAKVTNSIIDSNLVWAYSGWVFANNLSYGGGCFIWGSGSLVNCVFAYNDEGSNHGGYGGSGIHCSLDTSYVINCTVTHNYKFGLGTSFPPNYSGFVYVVNSILFDDYGGAVNGEVQDTSRVNAKYSDIQNGISGQNNLNCNPIISWPNYNILPGSCCIDAGDPNSLYNDTCFQYSLGTNRNDVGAHGGIGACQWNKIIPIPQPFAVSDGGTFCDSTTITASGGNNDTIYFQGKINMGTSFATPSMSQTINSSGTYYFREWSIACGWGSQGIITVIINTVPGPFLVTGGGPSCNEAVVIATGNIGDTIYWQNTNNVGTSFTDSSTSKTIRSSGTYFFRAHNECGWGTQESITVNISSYTGTIESTFDTGSEGWTVIADGQGPNWIANGGNPGGHLEAVDLQQGGIFYWVAPASFLGNKLASFHDTLKFDMSLDANLNYLPQFGDVILTNDSIGIALIYSASIFPGTTWTHFDVILDPNIPGWWVNTIGSIPATFNNFQQVLSNLTSLQIRGEFQGTHADICKIDNVVLQGSLFVNTNGAYCDSTTLAINNLIGDTIYWQGTINNGTSFSTPSTSQTVLNSGTYYFRSHNSCGWGAQGSALVNIYPSPSDPVISLNVDTIICTNYNTNLTWYDTNSVNPVDTGKYYIPVHNGTYYVMYTDPLSNCQSQSNLILYTSVNTNEYTILDNVLVYPNPTSGKFAIELGNIESKVDLVLLNSIGQEIFKKEYSNVSLINDELRGAPGIYFLKIAFGKNILIYKIVKDN